MRNAEKGLGSFAEIDRRIGLMAAADGTAGITDAVHAYLASWTKERILNVQKVDGGWGPFDALQRPAPMRGPDHILSLGESLRRQCVALKEAGFTPTPEFLEIELFFSLARQVVESWKRERTPARAGRGTGSAYGECPDPQGIARRAA